jgi:hypothetical protein
VDTFSLLISLKTDTIRNERHVEPSKVKLGYVGICQHAKDWMTWLVSTILTRCKHLLYHDMRADDPGELLDSDRRKTRALDKRMACIRYALLVKLRAGQSRTHTPGSQPSFLSS